MADAIKTPQEKSNRKAIDPNETPRQRFTRLAELRTSNAIESIRRLGLLGNRAQYEYEDIDVDKIVGAVQDALKSTTVALRSGKASHSTFKL